MATIPSSFSPTRSSATCAKRWSCRRLRRSGRESAALSAVRRARSEGIKAGAYATGIKLSRPDLHVIGMTGDGDCSAIGGNHFIHAARRNIGITTIVMNNNIYGMTSGQYSPMTPKGMLGATAPYGNVERPFDLCKLAIAAGATYVGRGTSYLIPLTIDIIENALQNRGFSVVEAISQCPTYFSRKNKIGASVEMLEWIKYDDNIGEVRECVSNSD